MMKQHEVLLARIELVRKAILAVRDRRGFRESPIIRNTSPQWAIGLVGALDFIKTGDVNKILLLDLREEVKKQVTNKK